MEGYGFRWRDTGLGGRLRLGRPCRKDRVRRRDTGMLTLASKIGVGVRATVNVIECSG